MRRQEATAMTVKVLLGDHSFPVITEVIKITMIYSMIMRFVSSITIQ